MRGRRLYALDTRQMSSPRSTEDSCPNGQWLQVYPSAESTDAIFKPIHSDFRSGLLVQRAAVHLFSEKACACSSTSRVRAFAPESRVRVCLWSTTCVRERCFSVTTPAHATRSFPSMISHTEYLSPWIAKSAAGAVVRPQRQQRCPLVRAGVRVSLAST